MTFPRAIHAVVFDMDGLLCDSESVIRDVMIDVAARDGRHLPMDLFIRMIGSGYEETRDMLLEHFGADFAVEQYTRDIGAEANARFEASGAALKPGVVELLDYLDAKNLPRAIATSSSPRAVQTHLGHSGIVSRFHTVVARGDYAKAKPNPEPYLTAASRLGIAPANCLALEDSHNGIRAAHGAGMMAIMVPDLLEATEEIRALCHCVSPSLHDVQALLVAHHR